MAKVAKKVAAKKAAKAEKKVVTKAEPKVVARVEKEVEVEAEVKEVAKPKINVDWLPSLTEMLEAGVHFGHSVKRRNPRMDEHVYAIKNGVQIFDLVKTRSSLEEACQYIVEHVGAGEEILLVGTKGQASDTVKSEAERLGVAYITNHWVGGLFTNWEQIKGRVDHLVDMRKKFAAGDYKKYTKKEQVLLKREMDRLERMYGGLVNLKGLPKLVFIVDPTREVTAMREAIHRGISVVAIVDTNADPRGIERLIPANDDALKSVVMLVKAVTKAVEMGLKMNKEKKA